MGNKDSFAQSKLEKYCETKTQTENGFVSLTLSFSVLVECTCIRKPFAVT